LEIPENNFLKIVQDMRVQIKYLKIVKKILEPFKQIDLAENNCQRKLENSWETLKMD